MVLNPLTVPFQAEHNIGPRSPMPFPDTGKLVKLATCPKCRLKGVALYHAPYERGYQTKCLKCGIAIAIKPRELPFKELHTTGGFTPLRQGVKRLDDGTLDATKMWNETFELYSIGYKRAYRTGLVPRSAEVFGV